MATLEVRVEKVTPSKSGKALRVKFAGNDTWYGAFKDSGLDRAIGQAVAVDIEIDEKFGPQIKGWKVMAPQSASPTTLPSTGSGVAPWFMPFVSNTIAHAISAGLIKEPSQLGAWARGAMQTAIALEDDVPL